MNRILPICIFVFVFGTAYAQIAVWNFEGETTAGSNLGNTDITVVNATAVGTGATSFPAGSNSTADSYSAVNWPQTNTRTAYFQFCVTGTFGLNLTSFTFDLRASGQGPANYDVQYSVGGGAYVSAQTGTTTSNFANKSVTLNQNVGANIQICVRIHGYNSSHTNGTFTVDAVTFLGASLPVELVQFEALASATNEVQLNWITASEHNNDHFTIETSTNGKVYRELSQIAGAGNTVEETSYTYVHTTPAEGRNYYRLRQTDFNGATAYSKVVVVNINKSAGISINPTTTKEMIYIDLKKGYKQDIEIQIFNLLGASVFEGILPAETLRRNLNVSHLQRGQYFLRLDVPQNRKVYRFIKL